MRKIPVGYVHIPIEDLTIDDVVHTYFRHDESYFIHGLVVDIFTDSREIPIDDSDLSSQTVEQEIIVFAIANEFDDGFTLYEQEVGTSIRVLVCDEINQDESFEIFPANSKETLVFSSRE